MDPVIIGVMAMIVFAAILGVFEWGSSINEKESYKTRKKESNTLITFGAVLLGISYIFATSLTFQIYNYTCRFFILLLVITTILLIYFHNLYKNKLYFYVILVLFFFMLFVFYMTEHAFDGALM